MSEKKKTVEYAIQRTNEIGASSEEDMAAERSGYKGPTLFESHFETESIFFKNCDYKDLLLDMQSKGFWSI